MPTLVEPRLPRGMRDILPQRMILRRYVIGVIERVFERYGFEPLQTPALELAQTLMGKYGPDAEKLIYDARHREGKEDLALRYDLSVPLSRVVGMNPQLIKPFKRYQIAPVWRAERPQKGRYREFYQCDADIVGTSSMLADAEIIAMIFTILTELGFRQFVTKLNNRKILAAIGERTGVPAEVLGILYRSIDKYDKIGREGVREELIRNLIDERLGSSRLELKEAIEKAELVIALATLSPDNPGEWGTLLRSSEFWNAGMDELREVRSFLDQMNVPESYVIYDLTMVRGLEYYTGPIFETVVTEPKIGSLTGGGRYDGLIGLFSKYSLPATGTTIGIERIIDVMEELQMFPSSIGMTVTQVLVTVFKKEYRADSIEIANELRAAGLNVEIWFEDQSGLGKQLKYAATKGIPFAIILGEDEAAAVSATLRDLGTGDQVSVPRSGLADALKQKLSIRAK